MKKKLIYLVINLIIFNGCDVESVKENNKPTPPILTSPNNNATNIKLDAVLNWTASTDGDGDVLKYNIFFGTVNPPTNKISELQKETSFTPTLKSNTTYYWKIEANDGKGGISESEVWNFKTIIAPPSVPTLTAPVNNATNINLLTNLTWTASTSSSGFTVKYNVFLDTSRTALTSSTLTKKVSSMQDGTSYMPTSLLSNSTYYWKIEANDGKGGEAVSEIRSFKTLIVLPTLPRLTSPDNNATNISLSPNLTWTASTSISGYPIKYNVFLDTSSIALTSSTLTKKVSSMQESTSYMPTGLLSNNTYYWKIEANDGNGGVATSEIKFFKTSIVPPSVPTLTAPASGAIEITLTPTLTWSTSTSSSGIAAKYNVYLGTEKTTITTVSSIQPETSYTANSLLKNTKYYWKIEAEDGNGGINSSVIDSFTTVFADLVNVEGGTFSMTDGSVTKSVTLTSYSIGKYEVTQTQWLSVMGTNPSNFNTCSDCPVEKVSWDDIQTFLTKLNTKTGKSYRLPTEAEWEYAARGGKKSNGYTYSGSNDIDSVTWHSGNSGSKTHVVGTTKKANELGIYDMSGNVWEWVSDWYGSYVNGSETNPNGPSIGSFRVLRGGSWSSYALDTRVSLRNNKTPSLMSDNLGFRLVLP